MTYQAAGKMWGAGKRPIPVEQLPSGTILVHPPVAAIEGGVARDARVSSADQKADRDRQVGRWAEFAAGRDLRVVEVVQDIGSGLNGHRRGLLRNPRITARVVEPRDRLMGFGFESVEVALAAQGRTLAVIDAEEVADDWVRDMTEELTSLCARWYGKRAAANKAKRALEAIQCP